MEQKAEIITLGVRDLDASRAFYVDGLGWEAALDVPGEVIFIQIGHGLLLSLWGIDDMVSEAGDVGFGDKAPTVAFGHLVESPEAVVETIDAAVAAGGELVTPATRRDWGGTSGNFADPDGYRWEVAWNPGFKVDEDGRVSIGSVDPE